jgi:hypothetical protein
LQITKILFKKSYHRKISSVNSRKASSSRVPGAQQNLHRIGNRRGSSTAVAWELKLEMILEKHAKISSNPNGYSHNAKNRKKNSLNFLQYYK